MEYKQDQARLLKDIKDFETQLRELEKLAIADEAQEAFVAKQEISVQNLSENKFKAMVAAFGMLLMIYLVYQTLMIIEVLLGAPPEDGDDEGGAADGGASDGSDGARRLAAVGTDQGWFLENGSESWQQYSSSWFIYEKIRTQTRKFTKRKTTKSTKSKSRKNSHLSGRK